MGTVLMCKNVKVFQIEKERSYRCDLMPGLMKSHPSKSTFLSWLALRYSSNSNASARKLKGIIFGQGNRTSMNKVTHALSLSDCYWLKDEAESLLFEQVSPYFTNFWKGDGVYAGGSIPTLYVSGFLSKEWVSGARLNKYGADTGIEKKCYDLCKICGVPCAQIDLIPDGVQVHNITSPEYMLEQADQSGRLDPNNFDESTILSLYGISGVQMLVIDAIVGNGDRHAGNFGWLRDTDTGEYVSMAPLYDFDHALDSKLASDRLLTDLVDALDHNGAFQAEAVRIATLAANFHHPIFSIRAFTLLSLLKNLVA